MIRQIVTDLDGTLLNENQKIPVKTKEYLKALQQRGIQIILASGRNQKRMQEMIDDLEIDGYCIAGNGYKIFHTRTKEEYIIATFTADEVQYYFQKLKKYNQEIMAFSDTSLQSYIPNELYEIKKAYCVEKGLNTQLLIGGPYHIVYDHSKSYDKIITDASFEESAYKICVKGEHEILQEIQKEMNKENCTCVITSEHWLEVLPKANSKGNALKKVCELMNYRLEDMIAFGDGENDLSMLAIVGKAYAMDNGVSTLKKSVKLIAPKNTEEGVYEILFEHFK